MKAQTQGISLAIHHHLQVLLLSGTAGIAEYWPVDGWFCWARGGDGKEKGYQCVQLLPQLEPLDKDGNQLAFTSRVAEPRGWSGSCIFISCWCFCPPLISLCRRALTGRMVSEWKRQHYEAPLSQQRHLSSKNNAEKQKSAYEGIPTFLLRWLGKPWEFGGREIHANNKYPAEGMYSCLGNMGNAWP